MGRRLYSDIERIDNELRERGVAAGAPLTAPQLFAIDSLHYEGDAAVEAGIASCGLTAASAVLDIGAGLGGPARFMAHTAGCRVCAVELQADVHAKGRELTQRCGLGELVSHVHGDILDCDLSGLGDGPGSFDAVASWLTFLHIPDKHALLTSCAAMIKPGGALYAEDFFARGAFTPAEERALSADVFCKELPTRQEYIDTLTACGFVDIVFEERTEPGRSLSMIASASSNWATSASCACTARRRTTVCIASTRRCGRCSAAGTLGACASRQGRKPCTRSSPLSQLATALKCTD